MDVNVSDVVDTLKEIVTSSRPLDPERLADLDIPLDDLVAPPAGR